MKALLVMAAGLVLAGAISAGAQEEGDPGAVLKRGKEAFESKCRLCHSIQTPLSKVKSRAEWSQNVKRMVLYGAPVNAADREAIVGYLTAQSTFAQRCSGCHDVTRVVDAAQGRPDWKVLVGRMAGHFKDLEKQGRNQGQAPLSAQEVVEIAAFLTLVIP